MVDHDIQDGWKKQGELEAFKRRADAAERECRRLNPLVVQLRRERDAAVDETSHLKIRVAELEAAVEKASRP